MKLIGRVLLYTCYCGVSVVMFALNEIIIPMLQFIEWAEYKLRAGK